MDGRILLVGFDPPEAAALADRLPLECVGRETLPRIVVEDGIVCDFRRISCPVRPAGHA
jgi:hypothetical protein